ncbi:hypothetical protein PGT21_012425 [Puccinia graminis f. sp. tritici]|uniref:Uncharacterized protein n=1 Tax=Puccinia graminis f. sp. tritici TaxID=56615 RepID=A0A5B0P192_PUCGR|nr:hypothetical protein PGT21_012425 [Puccinia graminis f. sp. tritici]KAA1093838.1 hypothetical protein PGTUg99_031578 [Puccinia graminis f. sp. tritici]
MDIQQSGLVSPAELITGYLNGILFMIQSTTPVIIPKSNNNGPYVCYRGLN